MTCEIAQQNLLLAHYGELPEDLGPSLEQHVTGCEDCRREWHALLALDEELALMPVMEPSPNLLAASRMALDEALDDLPARSLTQRLTSNGLRWLSFLQSAPALATLLLGMGFLGGNVLERSQVAQALKVARAQQPVILSNSAAGTIASVTGIVQTPNSDLFQINYNRVIAETYQGTLDDPQARQLLLLGTKLATTNDVQAQSVAWLSTECRNGHVCDGDDNSIRSALLARLRLDRSPGVRMKALNGLQPYIAKDEHVRDAVLDALMHDPSADVRTQAISMLEPVQADSSVRQVLRNVSSQDANPAIRNASFQALQGTGDLQ